MANIRTYSICSCINRCIN